MQSPSWAELVAELTTRGYHLVFWVEVECAQHGAFRGAAAWDEQALCCPRCQQAVGAAFLARGLTRDGEFPWKCVSPALAANRKTHEDPPLPSPVPCGHWGGRKFLARAKAELNELLPLAMLKTRIVEHAPQKPRAPRPTPVQMQQRIHLVAKLLVQGMTQREIAEQAGLDLLTLKVMCCRRKAELQTAVSEAKKHDL